MVNSGGSIWKDPVLLDRGNNFIYFIPVLDGAHDEFDGQVL